MSPPFQTNCTFVTMAKSILGKTEVKKTFLNYTLSKETILLELEIL
jgi:hypothetical protein